MDVNSLVEEMLEHLTPEERDKICFTLWNTEKYFMTKSVS